MNNKSALNGIYFPVILCACCALAYLFGTLNASYYSPSKNSSQNNKVNYLIDVIENNYVDSIDRQFLIENSISGMLEKLDPHSVYIPPKDVAQANEGLQGHFGGVGVRFIILRDTLMITNVIKGGPSQIAGLKSGDRIVKVDSTNITGKGIKNEDVFKLLKGPFGSKVELTIYRPKENSRVLKTIIRGQIPLPSIDAAFILKEDLGYIKLSTFSDKTPGEFNAALTKLKSSGMQKLILDLRYNSGGYLHGAISVADEFLSSDNLIVYTQGLHQKRENHYASKWGSFERGELIVLVNSGSASASEIVSGAIQDNDRGIILGRRTFGKGLVQQPIKLSDNSELRLTVSRYFTPTGRSIQKPYDDNENYNNELMERYSNGEMYAQDSSSFSEQDKFITPKGKVVYGGGGISPDIFVPLDSSSFSEDYSSLYYSTAFRDFCFDFFYANKNTFQFSSVIDYTENYSISNNLLEAFIDYAKNNNKIKVNNSLESNSKVLIKAQLKSEFASYLYNQEARYFLSASKDNDIQKAIKVLD